jgi:hypothetical protein
MPNRSLSHERGNTYQLVAGIQPKNDFPWGSKHSAELILVFGLGAFLTREEKIKGTLEASKLGDMVVLP